MEKELVEERKRKFLLLVPLVVIPFLVFIFYMMGGGQKKAVSNQASGLNTSLPSPILENNEKMDKLSLYRQAEKDSLDRQQQFDPFAEWVTPSPDTIADHLDIPVNTDNVYDPGPYAPRIPSLSTGRGTRPEQKVEAKLQELEMMLTAPSPDTPPALHKEPPVDQQEQLAELEMLMQQLQNNDNAGHQVDPELTQMSGMLDKILDIQHPSRIRDRIREQSAGQKDRVYPVSTSEQQDVSDLLTAQRPVITDTGHLSKPVSVPRLRTSLSGFYELEEASPSQEDNSLSAVIHQNQSLISGSTVKLRLQQDAYVQGQLLPKGNFVFGTCMLNGERLGIEINSIRVYGSVYPVSLTAYDLDGMPGIRIPGSLNRDAAKDGSEQAIQAIGLGSLDPSVGAQATAAGIEAAKTLLQKKVKVVKVHVKADYPVLLASGQQ